MRLRAIAVFLGVAAAVLLLSGCNSGKTTATAQAPTVTRGAPATTSTAATTTSIPSSNGAATAVLPAQFTLNADGSLSPPFVAGPGGTTILLTVTSRASHPTTLSVASRSLTVQPGGHASVKLAGLKTGVYAIEMDGRKRATLVVGAQPGP